MTDKARQRSDLGLRKMCQPGFLLDDGIGGAHRGEDEQECAQYKLGVVQTFCLKTCGTDDNSGFNCTN